MSIELNNLSFAYDGQRQIFENVSFTLAGGDVVCILGPNGIGKTTLLSNITGLLTPSAGNIAIEGTPMTDMSPGEIARKIGYVPQFIRTSFDFSVLEYVVTGWAPWLKVFEHPNESHYAFASEVLQEVAIQSLAEKPYSKLSGGEMQMVSIARALVQRATYVLMDEPTAHLDYGNQIQVLRTVRKLAAEGRGVLLTTHNPDHVLLLDAKVGLFDRHANFRFGPWQEILNPETLSDLYDVPVGLARLADDSRLVCYVEAL